MLTLSGRVFFLWLSLPLIVTLGACKPAESLTYQLSTGIQARPATPAEKNLAASTPFAYALKIHNWGLRAFIYQIDIKGDCVPDRREVCQSLHLLEIIDSKNEKKKFLYALGQVGDIQWKLSRGETEPFAQFDLTVLAYPPVVLKLNPALKQITDHFWLRIHPSGEVEVFET